MRRFIVIGIALILALATVQPAAAGSKARRVERMTAQFERLFRPMLGAIKARDLAFTDHGNGFTSVSYKLDRAGRADLLARSPRGKPFRVLACGHMASEPTNPAAMVNALIADLETPYYLWFVVLNATDNDVTRETTLQLTGPEEFELEVTEEEFPYGAGQVTLFAFNPEMPFSETGLYTHRVSVKGGGKVFYRFWAEEPVVTEEPDP